MNKNIKMGGYCPSCLKKVDNCCCLDEFLVDWLEKTHPEDPEIRQAAAENIEELIKRD